MANGRQHEAINMATFGIVTGGYAAARLADLAPALPAEVVVGAFGAYVVGSLWVTPDMDLADEKRVRPKAWWGRLGVLWVPYGRLFEHRGPSHSWLFGPLTRLAYLLLLIGWVPWVARGVGLEPFGWVDAPVLFAASVAGGFYAAQWLHLFVDGVRWGHWAAPKW